MPNLHSMETFGAWDSPLEDADICYSFQMININETRVLGLTTPRSSQVQNKRAYCSGSPSCSNGQAFCKELLQIKTEDTFKYAKDFPKVF